MKTQRKFASTDRDREDKQTQSSLGADTKTDRQTELKTGTHESFFSIVRFLTFFAADSQPLEQQHNNGS